MEHARVRLVVHLPSAGGGAQAPVDVLVVREVRLVEQPDLAQRLARGTARCSPAPRTRAGARRSPPTAARFTPWSCTTLRSSKCTSQVCDVEQLGPVEPEDRRWSTAPRARAVPHRGQQRRQEVRRDARVVVEQQDAAGAGIERGADAGVVAAGVAPVLRQRQDLLRGKRARMRADRVVARAVVDDQDATRRGARPAARLSRQSSVSRQPFQLSTTIVTSRPFIACPTLLRPTPRSPSPQSEPLERQRSPPARRPSGRAGTPRPAPCAPRRARAVRRAAGRSAR